MFDLRASRHEENRRNLGVNDELFVAEGRADWQYNAWLRPEEGISTWIAMIGGYKAAADLLIQTVIEKTVTIDYLVYPILFLYRHHTELQLKFIIELGKEDNIEHNIRKLRGSHKLIELWEVARGILKAEFDDDDSNLGKIDNILNQLDQIDPNSFSFRYPQDIKNNEPYLPSGLHYVNLINLWEKLDGALQYLDDYSDAIYERRSSLC